MAVAELTPQVTIGAARPRGGMLGVLPEVDRDALGSLTGIAREYGDLVRIRLGLSRAVLVSHPQLIEEVLVTRNHDFRKNIGTRRLGSLLGNGLLLSEGDFWLRQRRLMQPAFHRQRLSAMGETMVAIASQTLDGWGDGQTRDMVREITEITLRIAAQTLFGTEVDDDLTRIREANTELTRHFRSRLFSLMMLLPDSVPTPGNVRYQRAVHDLDRLVYRIVLERRAAGLDRPDLLGMLLAARDDDGEGMTDRQLRDEVMTLLLAGHETTALALTWAVVLLAQHPNVEAGLHAQIESILHGQTPTTADVSRLACVDQVVLETLRLYPTAWTIGREAVHDTQVGGQKLAKGWMVLASPWVVQRDARFFESPAAFRPQRWADGMASRLPRFAYFPFGGGQRVCIGSSFAQLEATLVLTTILQRFRLTLAEPDRPVEPLPVVTLRPRDAVPMRLTMR